MPQEPDRGQRNCRLAISERSTVSGRISSRSLRGVYRDLMPKSGDLHVFIPVTHWQPRGRPAHLAPIPATAINTATPDHQPR